MKLVLIVDDQPWMRDSTEKLARLSGADVVFVATSYREAVKVLEEETLDLVITDYDLRDEEGNGNDLCKFARTLNHVPRLVLWSGMWRKPEETKYADRFVEKGFEGVQALQEEVKGL